MNIFKIKKSTKGCWIFLKTIKEKLQPNLNWFLKYYYFKYIIFVDSIKILEIKITLLQKLQRRQYFPKKCKLNTEY